MLVLKRRSGESFVIDEVIKVKVNCVKDGNVTIGITAPKKHNVRRSELRNEKPEDTEDAVPAQPTLASPAEQCLCLLDRMMRNRAVIAVRENHFHLFGQNGALLAHGETLEEMCASALRGGL